MIFCLFSLNAQTETQALTYLRITRFNYMSKERLIENSKEMAAKIHRMQVKLKRLEQYQQEMSTMGNNTDSDFRTFK